MGDALRRLPMAQPSAQAAKPRAEVLVVSYESLISLDEAYLRWILDSLNLLDRWDGLILGV